MRIIQGMRVLLLLCLFVARPVFAFSGSPVHAEFAASFTSGYVRGKCGVNIEQLLVRLRAQGVDLEHAQVGIFTNGGYTLSVTHRRESGPKRVPGVSNFYHHVVLVIGGEVFDYDFGNEPRVLPMKPYIKAMFWDEPAVTQYTGLEDLRYRLDYKLSLVPALEYLKTLSVGEAPKLDLSDYYDGLI